MSFFKTLRKGRRSGSVDVASLPDESNGTSSTAIAAKTARAADSSSSPSAAAASPSQQQYRSSNGNGHNDTTTASPASPTAHRKPSVERAMSKLFRAHSSSSRSSEGGSKPTPKRKASSSKANPMPTLSDNAESPAVPAAYQQSPTREADGLSLTSSPAAPPPGGRPSDMFAGKGVAWGELDINSQGPQNPAHQPEDLSNFLKARRQWVPQFATDEETAAAQQAGLAKKVEKPEDISFSALPTSGSLMSIKDLDESHKRKQKLLDSDFTQDAFLRGASTDPQGQTDLASTATAPTASLVEGSPAGPTISDLDKGLPLFPSSKATLSPAARPSDVSGNKSSQEIPPSPIAKFSPLVNTGGLPTTSATETSAEAPAESAAPVQSTADAVNSGDTAADAIASLDISGTRPGVTSEGVQQAGAAAPLSAGA